MSGFNLFLRGRNDGISFGYNWLSGQSFRSHRTNDHNSDAVRFYSSFWLKEGGCTFGHAKKWLPQIWGFGRNGDKTNGVEPMLGGKGFCFGQRLTCNGGDMGFGSIHADVIGQLGHFVGGRVMQGRFSRFAACRFGQAHSIDCQVFDLACGDKQLGTHTARLKARCGFAQHGQLATKVIGSDRHFAHFTPTACCTVQQLDALKGQRKYKIRLHVRLLTWGWLTNNFVLLQINAELPSRKGPQTDFGEASRMPPQAMFCMRGLSV